MSHKTKLDILKEGMGTSRLWGYGKALDLQDLDDSVHCERDMVENTRDQILAKCRSQPARDEFRCLIVGGVDARHIIKTIARSWRHPECKIHFYIVESQAPVLVRQLLLLLLFMDTERFECNHQEHAELFLELYGNLFLRERGSEVVSELAKAVSRCITDPSQTGSFCLSEGQNILDLSFLKHRERDDLEFVCNYWRDLKRAFKADLLLDARYRAFYDRRYDSRENLIDWDYHMRLKADVGIVHEKEHSQWRLRCNAFEFRDRAYSIPNRTMATVSELYDQQEGVKKLKWGYFSEIITGPFHAYSTDSEKKTFFQRANNVYSCRSQDVAVYNVCSLLHEWNFGDLYESLSRITDALCHNRIPKQSLINNDRLQLHVMPCDINAVLQPSNKKFRDLASKKFDVVYLGSEYSHLVPRLAPLLLERGKVVAESQKYNLGMTEDMVKAYNGKIITLAEKHEQSVGQADALNWSTSGSGHSLQLLHKSSQNTETQMQYFCFGRKVDVDNGLVSTSSFNFSSYPLKLVKSSSDMTVDVTSVDHTRCSNAALEKHDSAVTLALKESVPQTLSEPLSPATELATVAKAEGNGVILTNNADSKALDSALNGDFTGSAELELGSLKICESPIPQVVITEEKDLVNFDGFQNLTPAEARKAKENFLLNKKLASDA